MSLQKQEYRLQVKTGGQEGAGTDANVWVVLEDDIGNQAPKIKLDKIFHNDLERNKIDKYSGKFPEGFGKVSKLRMTRDSKGIADDWFCDYIIVEDLRLPKRKLSSPFLGSNSRKSSIVSESSPRKASITSLGSVLPEEVTLLKEEYHFPIHRWVANTQEYEFHEFATCLPQHDPTTTIRLKDLEAKKNSYQYIVRKSGMVAQVESLPSDEKFSEEYYWTFATEKLKLMGLSTFMKWTESKWKTIQDLNNVFKKSPWELKTYEVWQEDWWFGIQRLQGVNPVVIKLCTEIDDKFGVTDQMVADFTEGLSLDEALERKKLFICDLDILDGLACKNDREVAAPIALFYLNKESRLMPIAIQLRQQKGPENPVYTPNDSPNTWLVAKMYYNNAEAQHHQALTHLGYTHLLMEGVVVCTHRNLSPSHPLFKLMAPHFLYLLAINTRGLEKLVSLGGWVDNCMTQGVKGIYELMRRGFDRWNFETVGKVEKDIENRGLLSPEVLPYYPYRDDAISLYRVIEKYVSTVVKHHYDTPDKIYEDFELKSWRDELIKPRDNGGVGLCGIPGSDQKGFTTVDDIIEIVAGVIATCSLGHAAANFQQYEQYGYVPNYPGILMSDPPKEKKLYTEKDIMALLPDMKMTLDIMVITKLLSSKGTKSLGDFEMKYLYDPVGVRAAEEFRKDLKKLSLEMKILNVDRQCEFNWLDPEIVPNSISV